MLKKTFSLDESSIEKLKEEAQSLHLGDSAFLRYLIWSYDSQNKKAGLGS